MKEMSRYLVGAAPFRSSSFTAYVSQVRWEYVTWRCRIEIQFYSVFTSRVVLASGLNGGTRLPVEISQIEDFRGSA
jgi:hypothetical protein